MRDAITLREAAAPFLPLFAGLLRLMLLRSLEARHRVIIGRAGNTSEYGLRYDGASASFSLPITPGPANRAVRDGIAAMTEAVAGGLRRSGGVLVVQGPVPCLNELPEGIGAEIAEVADGDAWRVTLRVSSHDLSPAALYDHRRSTRP